MPLVGFPTDGRFLAIPDLRAKRSGRVIDRDLCGAGPKVKRSGQRGWSVQQAGVLFLDPAVALAGRGF